MRTIDKIKSDIERCQLQIACIYDLPMSEQCAISLEGFQSQLKKLLYEEKRHPSSNDSLRYNEGGNTESLCQKDSTLRQLAHKASQMSIAQTKQT